MIYVPIKHLKSGMVLAQSVTHGTSFFSLLVEGQQLSEESISKLRRHNVNGVYIYSITTCGIDGDSLLDSDFKRETVTQLKKVYDKHTTRKALTFSAVKDFSKISDSLIDHALSRDECLLNVIEVRDYDTYTYTHSMNVAMLSIMMGIKLGYSRALLGELAMCGLLHDIGKTDISIGIINKPGALSPDEFEVIKNHPTFGVKRLSSLQGVFPSVVSGIGSHHERYDGKGYPQGLTGEKIPVYGRILALADVFDALTSGRTYRKAWEASDAIEYMMSEAQTHFDFNLLSTFIKAVAAYPLGTIVKLSNGVMGVVIGNNPDNNMRPTVKVISPIEEAGSEINLATDFDKLNVTIIGTISDDDSIPSSIF